MNLTIETDETLLDTEVLIRCRAVDESIAAIVASLQMHDHRIVGKNDDGTVMVPAGAILYFETVDRHTFAYTCENVFEVSFRISELEEQLANRGFGRIAKNCIVNLCRVKSLCPYVGSRLLAKLDNDEEIIISRKYAHEIKQRLGA